MKEPQQDDVTIASAADNDDREWSAHLMSSAEPWITLGRSIDDTRQIFGADDALLYIARRGTARCAFLLVRPRGIVTSPYIAALAVTADERGKGVGTRLMRFAEDLYRGTSRFIFICVSSFNTRAKALYERLGYCVVGEFPDYAIDGASEFVLQKRLAP